ncbi:MAG: hypothetical protein V3S55_11640 [Nitrospiraceae bacterium]
MGYCNSLFKHLALFALSLIVVACGSGGSPAPSSPSPPPSNPLPSVSSLSPDNTLVGGADFTLTVNGSGFISSSVIRWNGSDRTTTFVSNVQLTATVPASDIAAAGTAQVTVFTPSPGGGTSNAATFAINNPLPDVSSLTPPSLLVGGADFTLTVNGSSFIADSAVQWNGTDRTTTFVSATELQAAIPAADIAVAGTAQVAVVNPAPGGGTSSALTVTILNPVPGITFLSPASAEAGGADLTLSVEGGGFVPGSIVRWNGGDRTTTFVSSTQLEASISATDIQTGGTAEVSVFNLSPGGGTSDTLLFFTFLRLITKDLIFDPFTRKIYASLPGSAPMGNSLVPLDPETGTVGTSFFIGSEPGKLAISDDGQALYVSLDGAAAVRRFDIPSQTAGLQFSLGSDSFFGPFFVEDMEVMPGNPNTIAVSRKNLGISPRHAGVAIYENGVQLPNTTPRHTGSNVIEFSDSPSTLYGYNNETTEFGFRRMSVDASGVTTLDATGNIISGFGVDIEFAGGFIYSTTGKVVDPSVPALAGSFPGISFGALVEADSTVNKVFYLVPVGGIGNTHTLVAFDPDTFTQVGSLDIGGVGGNPGSLIRWGQDGLAFRTSDDQIFLIRTPLVLPPAASGNPLPVLNALSPSSAAAGGPNFILTVSGSNFVLGSAVQWNGAERTTTFVSSTELKAAISASDIAAAGAALVTVINPAPGGGPSSSLNFTIN